MRWRRDKSEAHYYVDCDAFPEITPDPISEVEQSITGQRNDELTERIPALLADLEPYVPNEPCPKCGTVHGEPKLFGRYVYVRSSYGLAFAFDPYWRLSMAPHIEVTCLHCGHRRAYRTLDAELATKENS